MMKKAEEQLERERVMQVLKSSSTVSGVYSLQGAKVRNSSFRNSSVVVGTNIYNQQQRSPSPSPMMGRSSSGLNRKPGYAVSSTSSGSDERAPPLPKRRNQQQPSPPLSTSSLEQVALASTTPYPTSAPPSSTATTFSNPENSNKAHVHPSFRSRSRVPVDSTATTTTTNSPEKSPRRTSLDLPSRGRPPPTHPDRKLHHLQYQYQPQPQPNSHTRSQSYPYSDPFAGTSSHLDRGALPPEGNGTNADESFESIYGPSSNSINPSSSLTHAPITTPSANRVFRSRSLHQTSPPIPPLPRSSLSRKRPESVQVFRPSDIGVEVDRNESMAPPPSPNRNSSSMLMMPTNNSNKNLHRRSSLSVSSTPSSSSTSLNHWPPPTSPHRQTPIGTSASSSCLTVTGGQRPSSSATKNESTSTNPLTSFQKTILQIQPHLDKARYKAEAGLSKRGFVRDGLRSRGKSFGSGSGDGEDEKDGLEEDGLEGLMMGRGGGGGGGSDGGKRTSRWRVNHDDDRAYDGEEVDQDSDWMRNEGMSSGQTQGRVQSDEDDGLEKDNLKWPAGEGWKPL